MKSSFVLLVAALTVAACGSQNGDPSQSEGGTGKIKAAITADISAHDVASVHYKVVAQGDGCGGPAITETTVALEAETLPASVAPIGAGPQHTFTDAFMVLPPGNYTVCATPLTSEGSASAQCASTQSDATVVSNQTTEVLLVSQCNGVGNGGLDVITTLNDPPVIDTVTISESKFITECETATISVSASDPNGDDVAISFAVVSNPPGENGQVTTSGTSGVFTPNGPGDYQLQITATDVFGGTATLTIPIHVSAVPEGCPLSFDFASLPQFYCNGTCGNWGGGDGCQQEDADVFCRLRTNNASSVATSFQVQAALDAPGVCCPPPTIGPGTFGCTDLGVFPVSGTNLNISVHPTSVLSTHGGGAVITDVVCTDP